MTDGRLDPWQTTDKSAAALPRGSCGAHVGNLPWIEPSVAPPSLPQCPNAWRKGVVEESMGRPSGEESMGRP